MRVTPALCDEPRDLFAAIFSSGFRHPGLRDQLSGTKGPNFLPSSGESVSRGILPSHTQKPIFSASVTA